MASKQSTARPDVHAAVTAQIIAAIEAGPGDWVMPWHSPAASTLPVNIASGNRYKGVNTITLWATAWARQYEHSLWGSYRQWAERGAQVRRGETSSIVVFYREITGPEHDDGEPGTKRLVARASHVFNVAQVDGFELPETEPSGTLIDPVLPSERAEAMVRASGADIRVTGSHAYYDPRIDQITMPERHYFRPTATSTATEGWYGTLLHELVHFSGAEHRLARTFGKRFGDRAYCLEEATAEMGAAILCAELGITPSPRLDHAQYVAHFLDLMKADSKALFAAASAASRAAEYLLAKLPHEPDT